MLNLLISREFRINLPIQLISQKTDTAILILTIVFHTILALIGWTNCFFNNRQISNDGGTVNATVHVDRCGMTNAY